MSAPFLFSKKIVTLNMDFYLTTLSSDEKIIGKFPQLDKMYEGFSYSKSYEIWGEKWESLINEEHFLRGFSLKYHAKLTDCISASQFGTDIMLMSDRLFNMIIKYSCMEYKSVKAYVEHRGRTYEYQYVYFPRYYNYLIDFNKSHFYIGNSSGWLDDIHFADYNECKLFVENIEIQNKERRARKDYQGENYLRVLQLYLDEKIIDMDFFRISGLLNSFIISSRLKTEIEEFGITGLSFSQAQGHIEKVWDTRVSPWRQVVP